MDFSPYMVFLTRRAYPYHLDVLKMEPPKSPKFNITLWQPWLAELTETPNGGSPCGSNGGGSPGAIASPGAGTGANPASLSAGGVGAVAEIAAAKQLPSAKWRRERRCTTRIPDYKHREPGLAGGNKALRSQSFNDKASTRIPFELAGRPKSREGGLHHSDGDLMHLDETDDSHDSSTDINSVRKTVAVPFSSLNAVSRSTLKPPKYIESPLDMSVKARSSPPSYSQAISNGSVYRPSVITQAPTNGSPALSVSPPLAKIDVGKGEYVPGSMSMCDPVIDEHFRRSLGADYMTIFNKNKDVATNGSTNGKVNKVATKDRGSSPIMFASDPCSKFLNTEKKSPKEVAEMQPESPVPEKDSCGEMEVDDCAGLSVDDHFAKALGDTWKKLQENGHKIDILKTVSPTDSFSKSNTRNGSAPASNGVKLFHSRSKNLQEAWSPK